MDIDLVLCRHLGKRFVSRLAHLQDELFEASRRAEQQHAHWRVALDAETMRDVAWPEDKCAGASQRPFAVAHERHLAFQDVPRFVSSIGAEPIERLQHCRWITVRQPAPALTAG